MIHTEHGAVPCGCATARLDGIGGVEVSGVGVGARGSGCQVVKSEMRQGPEVCRGLEILRLQTGGEQTQEASAGSCVRQEGGGGRGEGGSGGGGVGPGEGGGGAGWWRRRRGGAAKGVWWRRWGGLAE